MINVCDIQVFATVAGTNYNLNDLDGYTILEYSGLGITSVRRLTESGPFQQGDTDLGYRHEPRLITFRFGIAGNGRFPLIGLGELRRELMTIFRPRTNDPIILTIIKEGKRRRTNVNMVGELTLASRNGAGYAAETVPVALKAGDPRLYDPTPKTVSFSLLSSGDGWEIPWEIPWPIGESILDADQTIYYANGDTSAAEEFPVIRVNGPINGPIIQNLTTGETLPFTAEGGLVLEAGEYVDIDLNYGRKTAVKGDGASVDYHLADDNDLATWHLAYNTELLNDGSYCDGNNNIRVTGTGVTLATSVQITYYDRYVGL